MSQNIKDQVKQIDFIDYWSDCNKESSNDSNTKIDNALSNNKNKSDEKRNYSKTGNKDAENAENVI